MTYISGLPGVQKKVVSIAKSASFGYSYLENFIVAPLNDTLKQVVGAEKVSYYAKKTEGSSISDILTEEEATTVGCGYYENPDTEATDRDYVFVGCSDDKIYMKNAGTVTVAYDVSDDGFSIKSFSTLQEKKYFYIAIGDSTMSAQIYRFDGTSVTLISVTSLEAARLLSKMENRMVASGAGALTTNVAYSALDISGDYNSFATGVKILDGGELTGITTGVTALAYYGGYSFIFGARGASAHRIGEPMPVQKSYWSSLNNSYYSETDLEKNTNTQEIGFTIEGFGTSSMNGVIVARGLLVFCDEWNGVYSYTLATNFSKGKREPISEAIRETLEKYDLSSVALGYHPEEDILLVACASQKGGINDTVFVYNFQSKGWSILKDLYIRQFLWNDRERQMYGASSRLPAITKVFDGGYFNELGKEIKCIARGRYFDGGRRSQLKEYMESAVILGVTGDNSTATFRLYTDKYKEARFEKGILFSELTKGGDLSFIAAGTWGEVAIGGGAVQEAEEEFSYVQYYDFSIIPDHRRCAIEIEEQSGHPFAAYNPDVTQEVMNETDDDFL